MAGATWNCCRLGAFCVHHTTMRHVTPSKAKNSYGIRLQFLKMCLLLLKIMSFSMECFRSFLWGSTWSASEAFYEAQHGVLPKLCSSRWSASEAFYEAQRGVLPKISMKLNMECFWSFLWSSTWRASEAFYEAQHRVLLKRSMKLNMEYLQAFWGQHGVLARFLRPGRLVCRF